MNSFFNGKRVLITGASGYLAGNLLANLLPLGAKIKCLSRKPRLLSASGELEWLQGDVSEPGIWQKILPGIDIVFHLAAQTSAYWADQNPAEDYKINVMPVLSLIHAAKEMSLQKLTVLFSGTATECGIPQSLPVNESQPDHPVTDYDRHKLLAEKALLKAACEGVFFATTLRFSNLYGPGVVSSANDRGILNQMVYRALHNQPLTLINEGAVFMRDYLFVEDAVFALLCAASNIQDVSGGFFVIGSGEGHTLRDAFEKIIFYAAQNLGQNIPIESVERELSAIEKRNFVADSSSFIKKTGWRPRYSLDQGIDLMIKKQLCVS